MSPSWNCASMPGKGKCCYNNNNNNNTNNNNNNTKVQRGARSKMCFWADFRIKNKCFWADSQPRSIIRVLLQQYIMFLCGRRRHRSDCAMRSLVCAFTVRTYHKNFFSMAQVKTRRNWHTYLFILICCHSDESCLFKSVRVEWRPSHTEDVIGLYNMNTWLILVHGIQDNLKMRILFLTKIFYRKIRIIVIENTDCMTAVVS